MRRNKGFTLIELMIVVAIIAIIAAIAIPNLLGAKKSANEASAISTCRTISTVCEQYRNRTSDYPAKLDDLAAVNLIDSVLGATHKKSGYQFDSIADSALGNLSVAPFTTWTMYASPEAGGGDRWFRITETGVLEWAAAAAGPYAPVQ